MCVYIYIERERERERGGGEGEGEGEHFLQLTFKSIYHCNKINSIYGNKTTICIYLKIPK